jgi:predicted TIM-barrel enzyme
VTDSDRGFTRATILSRLRDSATAGRPILGAGASMGIVAKCAEIGGADLIIVYSTGRSRFMGLPTTPLGDSNTDTLAMYDEIANVVERTPIIGGIEAVDPRFMRLPRLLDRFRSVGYDCLVNFPTIANLPDRRRIRGDVGLGFERETSLVRLARKDDYFSMVYAYSPDDARAFVDAGADVVVAHVGWTAGGLVGATDSAASLDGAAEQATRILRAALDANPEIIPLAHGGPFSEPDDTRFLYQRTPAIGFVGASSIERIPIERAVVDIVTQFKAIPLR